MASGRLLRLVAGPEGSLRVGRRLPGRGAWVCGGDPDCLRRALRRKVVTRALRREIDADAAARLHDELHGELRRHFPALPPDARD